MAQIIGVRFKKVGKVYYFDPCGLDVHVGQHVIVETARGVEFGEVALANRDVIEGDVVKPLKKLIRIASESDEKVVETNQKRAKEAFAICEKKIAEHKLDMKLVSVEYTFDLNKVLFYFTADGRIDFRDLVKDLASVFRTRIELRQIGVRDEAKVLGGLGICGRPLCCASFLDEFQPVSINMAKQQNLSLSPTKISGTCGRLMCCLKYEQEAYEDLARVTPRIEATVQTPDGVGTVLDTNMLRGTCLVRLEEDPDTIQTYRCVDCQVLQQGRKPRKSGQHPNLHAETSHSVRERKPAAVPQQTAAPVQTEATAAPQAAETDSAEAKSKPKRRKPQKPDQPRRDNRPKRNNNNNEARGEQQQRPQRKRRRPNSNGSNPQQDKRERPQHSEDTGFMDANRQPAAPTHQRKRRPRRRPDAKPENKSES